MTDVPSVDAYLDGKNADAARLFRRFAELVEACAPSEVAPSSSIVHWKRARVFAGAFVHGRRLGLNIDLLREAPHPCLLAAFPTTKRVITHGCASRASPSSTTRSRRCSQEAYDDVGPGTGPTARSARSA